MNPVAAIHILDRHTAELIAAGEVVERPASVVKELTENAIDAGAHTITVSIEHGGTAVIQIADDGCGIEAEFISTAFIRHATSKIKREEDLESIQTLGFRGEALASVASVSRVELLTKTPADEYAYLYRIEGGFEQGIEPAARPAGTTITVRDLFYNTPARMKFLKKDATEGNYVADVVTQLALSHPEISFKFLRDGKAQFQTPGDGNLLGAAYAVLSREFAKELVRVQGETGCYTVYGLVTPPRQARASRAMQFFFINGRYVKNRTMMAALEAAYKGAMMQGKFPGCVLFLTMPPQLVDVNVHPAKTEVRFAREKEVFDAVYQSVKTAIAAPESTERAFSFNSLSDRNRHASGGPDAAREAAEENLSPTKTPSAVEPVVEAYAVPMSAKMPAPMRQPWHGAAGTLSSESPVPYRVKESIDLWPDAAAHDGELPKVQAEPELQDKMPLQEEEPQQTVFAPFKREVAERPMRLIGEVFDTYIVAQRGEDLCLLDKHAAHERLIYESLAASYGNVSGQMLLTPIMVQLSAEEKETLLQSQSALQMSGLEIEDFGGSAVIVRAVPADVEPRDVEDLVVELAGRLAANPRDTVSEKTEWVLHSIACRAAIKAGDKTHESQLLRLAQEVLDGKIPPFCPHGRPIVLKIPRKELEKQFGRLG